MTYKKVFVILNVAFLVWLWNTKIQYLPYEWGCVWNQIKYGVALNFSACPKTDHE